MEVLMRLGPAKQYAAELGASLAAYGIGLTLFIRYLQRHPGAEGVSAAVFALLPMLPLVGVCWAFLRALHRMDELWRRVHLEGLSLAFAATALVTLSYGFLEMVGFPRLSMFWVWPLMASFWIAGCGYSARRYR
jgi:hypothetical protein